VKEKLTPAQFTFDLNAKIMCFSCVHLTAVPVGALHDEMARMFADVGSHG
jgi:hypothetical protein